jgi:hypothetical protein
MSTKSADSPSKQLALVPAQICTGVEHGVGALFCLCTDGSMWVMRGGSWQSVPAPVAPDPPTPPEK